MRPKRTTFDVKPNRLTGDLHIVMKQLEPRILRDSEPYDASPPKVRKRPDPAELHHKFTVTSSDGGEDILDFAETIVGLFAEELEREMKARFVDPRQIRRALAERLGCVEHASADFGRQVDRNEETHSGF
jgi:hypothetical protein